MLEPQDLDRVTVLGAGTMGHGIAQVCAVAGMQVTLCDRERDALERALVRIARSLDKAVSKGKLAEEQRPAALDRVVTATDLPEACAGAQLVVEAVPEDLELKQGLLARVEEQVGEEVVLATNTSSLSIDALASVLRHPERFLGLHFFNPVPVMALLEIVTGAATPPARADWARRFAERIGKQPIVVRDSPGFASSRLGIALALEAIRMLEEEVASAEDIDRAMELGYRHPMGPLRLTDLVGLDVRLGIARYLVRELGPRFAPPRLLEELVEEGRLGRKTGRGFHRWE